MNEFISLVREVWADSTFGVSPAELLTALGVFLTFAVLRGLFTRFVLGGLERLTQRTQTEIDDALDEMELLGFPLCSPFKLLKETPAKGILADEMMNYLGKQVNMIGYVVTVKPTHTIHRELMNFGCFLDEAGKFFDTVHFPPQLKKHPFRGSGCYLVKGKVVEEFGFPSLEVNYMEKLPFVSKEDL